MTQYLYPQNLKATANLWLWSLRDFCIIGIAALLSVVILVYLKFFIPAVVTLVYESLFEPNSNKYVLPQTPGKPFKYHEDDRYIYKIKQLTSSEIQYCNALFMDRIDTYLGFPSFDSAVGSIMKYKKLNEYPYVPRVDYTQLYEIIRDRYSDK